MECTKNWKSLRLYSKLLVRLSSEDKKKISQIISNSYHMENIKKFLIEEEKNLWK